MKHMFINEIYDIIQAMQTRLRGKEYQMKYKSYHLKEAILVKPSHLDHSFEMGTKFEQTKGHELGVKKTREKKPKEEMTQPQNAQLLTRASTLLKWGRCRLKVKGSHGLGL